jgi:hypothetical protein
MLRASKFKEFLLSTVQEGAESRVSDLALDKSIIVTTTTFRFYLLYANPMNKGLENQRISQIEQQINRTEYKI